MLVKLVARAPRKLSALVSQVLFEAGAQGIEELEGGRRLVVYAETVEQAQGIAERARERLSQVAPGPRGIALEVEVDESSDWATAWTEHLAPVALTPSLVIQPLWDTTPAPAGSQRLWFDPKLSFGDGAHATTRLASLAVERVCRKYPGSALLDFGSGTGVLSFVALRSGAASAWGVDIDPVSVAAAQRNAALNDLSDRAHFALPEELGAREFDLVVANLEAPALRGCAADLLRRSVRAQHLIVTGFLSELEVEMAACFGPRFVLESRTDEAGWALLDLVPRS